MDEHGGRLIAEAASGGGSRFVVEVPVRERDYR